MVESPYARWAHTDRQLEILTAWEEAGRNSSRAAEILGIKASSVVRDTIGKLKARAAREGYSPEHDVTHPVPPGFKLKRHSQYYDKDGNAAGKWVIATADEQAQQEILREAFDAMAAELEPLAPIPLRRDAEWRPDLLNLYTLADGHLGMFAWGAEAGDDWDMEKGERILADAMDYCIAHSPPAESCVIAVLGDLLHHDGLDAVTPRNRHPLDSSARIGQIARAAVRVVRGRIARALEMHRYVRVIIAEGNHDLVSSMRLRIVFEQAFADNPRVEIVAADSPYTAIVHGRTFLGFHHGHIKGIRGKSGTDLTLLFADTAEWAACHGGRRYIHTGHRHDAEEIPVTGARLIQHPTLIPRDAHAAREGYLGGREMRAICYHAEHGETGRLSVTPEMLAGP